MDGHDDIGRAAAELSRRIPAPLAPLARIAYNYAWSWLPGGTDLFLAVDADRFELCKRNPVRLLQEASWPALDRAAADTELLARAAEIERRIDDIVAAPAGDHGIDPARPVGFLCAEFGVHVSLPVYSGGLGALAGDILKEASDLRVPMVAVGLMYRRGFFRQRVDAAGWQHEYWLETDPERLPAALVRGPAGQPLTIEVPLSDGSAASRIWRVDVGRVPLFLLDTDFGDNEPLHRWITGRLYEGDSDTRLAQYTLLGVGGVRALRALGFEPSVIHLNEGHAALAPLELALGAGADGTSVEALVAAARERTVFTTHTPVPAGNDSYPAAQVTRAFAGFIDGGPVPAEELVALGRSDPDSEGEPFGITQVALRLSRAANGVSRRHGEVAREMWTALWPGRPAAEIPIGYVTNGVHIPTWIGEPLRELLNRHLGEDWLWRAGDHETWSAVAAIPDDQLWAARTQQRAELVAMVKERSTRDRLERADTHDYVMAASRALRDDVLTIGFARRVATYKRLELLTRDTEFARELLGGERPVQLVLAGKAHPRDEDAKRVIKALFDLKALPVVADRVVFLDDYDLATAAALTRGCDVWLNLPRPPLEASGTSGMKSVINGGLQLSVLDGWWAEGYDGTNGWAISGEVDDDHTAQDERDTARLHALLTDEVVPAFYHRDPSGLPTRWLELMRASLRTLSAQFSATRMVRDYVRGPYAGGGEHE
ncbi:MAG TPA: alpha-glucan family phosphorylase [Solirubrobacteraceae bacterium]